MEIPNDLLPTYTFMLCVNKRINRHLSKYVYFIPKNCILSKQLTPKKETSNNFANICNAFPVVYRSEVFKPVVK